jgi:hypothetical protein
MMMMNFRTERDRSSPLPGLPSWKFRRARPKGPPVTDPYEDLAVDLISRTEKAVRRIGSLSADTGIQFEVEDAVDAVERGLPADYPAPADSDPPRRDLIARIVQDILSGAMYEE